MEINATLIGQLLTFVVLVWFTMKYVWPPITKALEEREKKTAAGLEFAEQSKRELEAAEKKAAHILTDAKVNAAQVIELAHKRSEQIVEEAKETARVEGKRLIEVAQEDIQRQLSQTKENLRKQLAVLAVAGAEKIIQRNLDAATQTDLLNEIVSEI